MKNITIAIDGPAGSGKSTVAKYISKEYKIIYLDTGAMYRAFALFAIRNGADTKNWNELEKLLEDFVLEIKYINGEQKVILNGEDVSGLIRTNQVSLGASDVAVVPAVRLKMVELQREIAKGTSVVMDGRDIGTYVLPDADLKIFLTASAEERAYRRYLEMEAKGDDSLTLEQIKEDIIKRDKNDSEREFAPLRKADDAILLDSTGLQVNEVINIIKGYIKKWI